MKVLIILASFVTVIVGHSAHISKFPISESKILYHRQKICITIKGDQKCISTNKAPGDPEEADKLFNVIKLYEEGKQQQLEPKIRDIDEGIKEEAGLAESLEAELEVKEEAAGEEEGLDAKEARLAAEEAAKGKETLDNPESEEKINDDEGDAEGDADGDADGDAEGDAEEETVRQKRRRLRIRYVY